MLVGEYAKTSFITVVMPVRNESRFIKDTLMQLVAQDYPSCCYEVIVVDGMSEDDTREIVRSLADDYPQIVFMDNPKQLSGAGRNIGFKNGRGDYFLVVDGHCYIPDNQLLVNVAHCFEETGADCLGRPQPLDPPGLTDFQKLVALARASFLGHSGESMIFGRYEGFASPVSNGAAYARRVFDKVGYVDENFDAAEDVEFNYRVELAGLKCFTSPKLTVRYYPRENLRGLFRQMTRYGKGRCKFAKKHPQALTFNQLIPAAFVIGIILVVLSFFLIRVSGPILPFMLLIPYILYTFLIVGDGIRITLKYDAKQVQLIPLILFTIHFGLGYGFLRQCIQSKFKT